MADEIESIGSRVRRMREGQGWSQRQLGARSKTSGAYINQLESGKLPKPGANALLNIAEALGISVDELIGKTSVPQLPTEHLSPAFIKVARRLEEFLDEEDWSLLTAYLEGLAAAKQRRKRRAAGQPGPEDEEDQDGPAA